jgi:multidrug efflux pump subunit AcrA (membrane-fusion protein)
VTIICGAERKRGEGHIVRAEGALDKETGLLHAVAEVRDPYAVKTGQAPLMPGLFVNAEIVGRDQSGVFVLPSRAVNASYEVLWVDRDDRLQPNDRPATSGFIRTCKGSMTNQTRGSPPLKPQTGLISVLQPDGTCPAHQPRRIRGLRIPPHTCGRQMHIDEWALAYNNV